MLAPRPTAVSLFAGCGGSDVGLRAAGFEVIWANDREPSACRLYPRVTGRSAIHEGDVRDVKAFPAADLLAGCYPCTGYSQGGTRKGADDSRNLLYREFDRALRIVRPRAFVVENVNGLRFSQNRPLLDAQLTRFRLAGYRVTTAVLDAADYGLAQRRRRLFLVGLRSDLDRRFQFPEPTHGPGRERPWRTQREAIAHLRDRTEGTVNTEPLHWYYLSRNRRRPWGEPANCVVAHWRQVNLHPDTPPLVKLGKDRWAVTQGPPAARRLSFLECAALQGFPDPDAFDVGRLRNRYLAIGNAVPPPLFEAVAGAVKAQAL